MTAKEIEVAKALTKLCKKKEMCLKQKPLKHRMIRKQCSKRNTFNPLSTKCTMRLRVLLNSEAYDHILAWTQDGKAFVIKDQNEFVRTILLNHLKGGKYSSFIRKLYRWGFNRVSPNTYYNKNFQRGYYDRYSKLKGFENTFTQVIPKKKVRFLEDIRIRTSIDSETTTSFVDDSSSLPMMKQQKIIFPTKDRMSVVNKIIRDTTKPRRRCYDDVINHRLDSGTSPFIFVNNISPRITTLTPSRRQIDIDYSSAISSSLRSNRLSSCHDEIMKDAMTVLINDRLKQKEALHYKTELLQTQIDLNYQRIGRTLAIQEWLLKKS